MQTTAGDEEEEERDEMGVVNNRYVKETEVRTYTETGVKCSRGRLKSQSDALEPQSHNPTSKATVIKVWCLHNVILLANYLEFKSTLTGLMTLANRTTATR